MNNLTCFSLFGGELFKGFDFSPFQILVRRDVRWKLDLGFPPLPGARIVSGNESAEGVGGQGRKIGGHGPGFEAETEDQLRPRCGCCCHRKKHLDREPRTVSVSSTTFALDADETRSFNQFRTPINVKGTKSSTKFRAIEELPLKLKFWARLFTSVTRLLEPNFAENLPKVSIEGWFLSHWEGSSFSMFKVYLQRH